MCLQNKLFLSQATQMLNNMQHLGKGDGWEL